MSIEMDNPKTVLEKVDASHNLVEQIRLAIMIGNKSHAMQCVDKASKFLGEAVEEIQDQITDSKWEREK